MAASISPTVSVVMSAYNLERFVGETIESVLRQTYSDFEFIIIDNGSEDNTAAIIRGYTDHRIRLLSEPINLGPSLAVNRAIEHSQGKYLALLAADDLWMPEKLAHQVAFLDDHPETGAIFTTVKPIDENGHAFADPKHFYFTIFEQPNRQRHEWLRHFFREGNCLCAVSSLVRRSAVSGEWFRPEMLQLSDFELWIRIVLESDIHVIQEKLTCFRIRSGDANTSGSRVDVGMRCAFEAATRIAPLLIRPPVLEAIHLIFSEFGADASGWNVSLKKWRLAGLFIEHPWEAWRLFGLTLQSDLLADVNSRRELMVTLGPRAFSEHFRTVGVASPIGLPACRAQIYWPLNGAFSEGLSSFQPYEEGIFTRLVFTIPLGAGESMFRFDPCDSIGTVFIREITLCSPSDSEERFVLNNADLQSYDGCARLDPHELRFATFWNPNLIFRLPGGLCGKQVKVEITLLHSLSTVELQNVVTNLRMERDTILHEREAMLSAVRRYNSHSWWKRALHKVRFHARET